MTWVLALNLNSILISSVIFLNEICSESLSQCWRVDIPRDRADFLFFGYVSFRNASKGQKSWNISSHINIHRRYFLHDSGDRNIFSNVFISLESNFLVFSSNNCYYIARLNLSSILPSNWSFARWQFSFDIHIFPALGSNWDGGWVKFEKQIPKIHNCIRFQFRWNFWLRVLDDGFSFPDFAHKIKKKIRSYKSSNIILDPFRNH